MKASEQSKTSKSSASGARTPEPKRDEETTFTRRLGTLAQFVKSIFTTAPKPASSVDLAEIGDKDELRVIAFSAGGPETIFEFGTVHAFLVTGAPRPHIITGTSAGAVIGAVLADVLQAGDKKAPSEKGTSGRLAQVAQFRAYLNQLERLPEDIEEAALPDLTEVSARTGLVPLNSPTHRPREKADRTAIALARFGLIRLLNGLLSSRIKFEEVTRFVRLYLDVQALGEWRLQILRRFLPARMAGVVENCIRPLMKIRTFLRLWHYALRPLLRDAPLVLRCIIGPLREDVFKKFPTFRSIGERLGFARLRKAKDILFEPVLLTIGRVVIVLLAYPVIALAWVLAPPTAFVLALKTLVMQLLPASKWSAAVLRLAGLLLVIGATVLLVQTLRWGSAHWNAGVVVVDGDLVSGLLKWVQAIPLNSWILFATNGLVLWFEAGLLVSALLIFAGVGSRGHNLLARLLHGFNLDRDILTSGVLRRFLMRAFDPGYFGNPNYDQAVNEALGGRSPDLSTSSSNDPGPRTLGDFVWNPPNSQKRTCKKQPILVAPVAADVATGNLITIEPRVPIVEALGAACALPPWFAPEQIEVTQNGSLSKCWLVDGSAVALEPIQPVFDLIKQLHLHRREKQGHGLGAFADLKLAGDLHSDPKYIELCVIAPFPTRRLLDRERHQMWADMGLEHHDTEPFTRNDSSRAGTLYRLRNILSLRSAHAGKDERNLVLLRNLALLKARQQGSAVFCSNGNDEQKIEHFHVFAHLREIEPTQPLLLIDKLVKCVDGAERLSLIRKIIADGCRTSLLSLYRNQFNILRDQFKSVPAKEKRQLLKTPPCRALRAGIAFPGSSTDVKAPPGIAEICNECQFFKRPGAAWRQILNPNKEQLGNEDGLPDWGEPITTELLSAPKAKTQQIESGASITIKPWPHDRQAVETSIVRRGKDRSTVTLVFSGGVFRGVFQVGVLNALNEAGVRPDVVAGASVGTIMAAFAARIFADNKKSYNTKGAQIERRRRIAGVAAAFLAIDRLILTDRFADFIRRFTLRAGSANFSLRDADHLFRRFDRRNWERLSSRSRRVLAGIHRMAYIDPIELLDLLGWNSPRRDGELVDKLLHYGQDALDRAGVGTELLGAEPLEQLIKEHVLDPGDCGGTDFDEFVDGGIHFLATTTNLTTGEIDVLGSFTADGRCPCLVPGLLASSAFPSVFRPRMNWELRPGISGLPEELVDGGIADNLPIVPVSRFLFLAGRKGWIAPRPKEGPHLLLTASLEPKRRILNHSELKQTVDFWVTLRRRVNQLRYNVKIDSHSQAQMDLRKIHSALKPEERDDELLDLHISCVKPEWLSGTFAFHPMLGFRRERQARSIAHGCACTLAHLQGEERAKPEWTRNWWNSVVFGAGTLEVKKDDAEAHSQASVTFHPSAPNWPGACYFRRGHTCPFSQEALGELGLKKETAAALSEIYRLCGQPKTHRRQE